MNHVKEPFDIDSIDADVGPYSGDEKPFNGPEITNSAQIALVQERFPNAASGFSSDVTGGYVRVIRPRVGQDVGAKVPNHLMLVFGSDNLQDGHGVRG